jgi:hypothetical protein
VPLAKFKQDQANLQQTTRKETTTCFSKGRGLNQPPRGRGYSRPLRGRACRRPLRGRRQRIQLDRFTVARQNVWQVLDQRPSRLARRMAVRGTTVTRCAKAVKTYANPCGLSLHGHKRREHNHALHPRVARVCIACRARVARPDPDRQSPQERESQDGWSICGVTLFGPGWTCRVMQTPRDAARAALRERARMWLHPLWLWRWRLC